MRSASSGLAILGLMLATVAPARAADESPVDYVRQIRPIFTRHCFECHGPDKQESGLRLDTVAGWREGGYNGPAVVEKQSGESLLVTVLEREGDVARMPFEKDPLSADEIALVRRWIDEGATAPDDAPPGGIRRKESDHWSFQPIAHPSPPEVEQEAWCRNDIDRFILAELERHGFAPSPEADRATLIRRLSFDLLGLPPSIEEVAQFLSDPRPDAYERLVERLLASPHYGERWGRHWLDVARYADSNGYTIDGPRSIWKYRDWVIDAMNRDLPFDEFTIEQIAGDLLPDATTDQIVATGFHRNTLINQEGGTDPEQFRVEAVVDRVSTTGAAFLGLTLGCARCHDHKFDEITQRDFYSMFAFYNNVEEPTLPLPTPDQARQLADIDGQLKKQKSKLARLDKKLLARQSEWEAAVGASEAIEWHALDVTSAASSGGATITTLDNGSLLVGGKPVEYDTYTLAAENSVPHFTALKLETLTDDSLPRGGPGLAPNGNFVLSELNLYVPETPTNGSKAAVENRHEGRASEDHGQSPGHAVLWSHATADHSQNEFPVTAAIDNDPATGWAINVTGGGKLNVDRQAVFVVQPGESDGAVDHLTVELVHSGVAVHYNIGCFRLSVTDAPRERLLLSDDVRQVMAVAEAERSDEQRDLVRSAYLDAQPERAALAAEIARLDARRKKIDRNVVTTMVMRELPEPRETHVMIRGDFLRPGARVSPGVPAVLPPLDPEIENPNRLDLARWLVSPENPLTARVIANRVWQRYFGEGLVATENDFGTQGSPPTHPELLDWLASELIRRGWSLKEFHRLIVSSATYRQSSDGREGLAEADPYNRWLGRQSRHRFEAEVVRDAALAASGLLTPTIGGPSVFPPQPEGVYRFTQRDKAWRESEGPDRYRRGMYTYFWRSSPHPMLTTFDAPDSNTSCTRRVVSDTPLQALTLANDRAFFEFAQALAARVLSEAPSAGDAERIDYVFRLCLSRAPSAYESQRLQEFLDTQRREFAEHPNDAVAAVPDAVPVTEPLADAAAWTAVARVLLNLDEFITRE